LQAAAKLHLFYIMGKKMGEKEFLELIEERGKRREERE
jgi:hypothetical protein